MAKSTKKRKKRQSKKIKIIKIIILSIILILLIAGGIYAGPKIVTVIQLANDAKRIADESTIDTFKDGKTTIIYDTNGEQLCTMKASKDMYYIQMSDIPKTLANSFVVMEDRDFYNHSGIDIKAIIRAVIINSRNDTIVQGASTITQQLAKNVFLSQEVTWERKVKEIFLAQHLEKKYSKDQILEFYLNNIYFSNGYYGIEAAARGYFGKSASELSVSQQAFIAAIPNNPTKYNPLTNYDATITRRNLILKELRDADYIDSMTYNTAIAEEITITGQKAANKNSSVETYARHCATEELMKYYGFTMRNNFDTEDEYNTYEELYQQYYSSCQQMLINGGYTIYTSIDPDIQASLQESIDNNLSSFKKVSDDGIYELQGAATCIDNSTGNVVAIVGSRSQDDLDGYTLNRAYQSYRQPGSCIKPVIVYVPYLQLGNNPDTIVNDEKIAGGPSNADGTYSGQMTLRTAVSKSKNTVAWKIYRDDITPKAGIGFLLNMGFHKIWMDKSTNAAALGGFTYGVSTEEMAGAYATIVNDGEYRQPTCVEKILNTSGKAIVDTSKRSSRVYDTNSCRMMTDMLRTVVTSGTGVGAEPSNAIVAGKTGTTNSNKDAWFCGYSQYYTTAIWMGYDYPKTLSSVKTLAIFKDFMYDIHKDKKKVEFKTANGSYTKKNQTETETQSQTEEQTTTQQETTTVTPTTKAATTTHQATTKAQTPTTQQAATKTQQTKEQKTGEWEAPTKEDAPAQGRGNAAHTRYARPHRQGRAKAQEKGGTGEEAIPQEADRHREAVRRRYYDTAEIKILSRYLCRSDGEIRAAKGHRRLESSPQVHAAVLSGYTETRRQSESGGGGFAAAERNGAGGIKAGEKRDTDREAERGGNCCSRQHCRECRFSFWQ